VISPLVKNVDGTEGMARNKMFSRSVGNVLKLNLGRNTSLDIMRIEARADKKAGRVYERYFRTDTKCCDTSSKLRYAP
jgi:hypothetical protein